MSKDESWAWVRPCTCILNKDGIRKMIILLKKFASFSINTSENFEYPQSATTEKWPDINMIQFLEQFSDIYDNFSCFCFLQVWVPTAWVCPLEAALRLSTKPFKGGWAMTERPVAFPVWQEVRTPTEEILLFVILLKIEGKGEKKEK